MGARKGPRRATPPLAGKEASHRAGDAAARAEVAAGQAEQAADEAATIVDEVHDYLHDPVGPAATSSPGAALNTRSPFRVGLFFTAGALLAFWLGTLILKVGPILVLIVVAVFLAVGLNPLVERLMRRGMKRPWALLIVIAGVIAAITAFVLLIAPIVGDQVTAITDNAPGWLDQLQHNKTIQNLDDKYAIIDKIKAYIEGGDIAKQAAGGLLGFGAKVLSFLGNTFVVVVLTLYFLASLPAMKRGLYRLAPASRRTRVSYLGDRVLKNIGGFVSGQFLVAMCAGISTLVFLFVIGLGEYAVALALVVALLDVIPMIGATLGAIIVCAIGFATDVRTGIICVIFYLVYQQVENYVIYPKVMSKSVDVPGSVTVIAALIGASLLGVVGAMLAVPVAASILLLVREVFIPQQEAR